MAPRLRSTRFPEAAGVRPVAANDYLQAGTRVKLLECRRCGQLLYCENTPCERCGHFLGYLPGFASLSVVPHGNGWWRALATRQQLSTLLRRYRL